MPNQPDDSRPQRPPTLSPKLAGLSLRHVAGFAITITICATIIYQTLQTGEISPERVRNLTLLAGALFGLGRVIELLNALGE